MSSRIVGGIVGGDMNAIDKSEDEFHKANDVKLRDAWKNVPAPSITVRKPFQKDETPGGAKGNTWGYQSDTPGGARDRKRLEKFFYTGSLETVAIDEAQDVTGRIGRLGIGLMTEVEVCETKTIEKPVTRGKLVKKPTKWYCSHYDVEERKLWRGVFVRKPSYQTRINTWVSDHFGIVVGVKVLTEQASIA